MPRVFKTMALLLLLPSALSGVVLAAQQTPAGAVQAAPIPPQVLSAKKIFISNVPGALYLTPRNAEDDPYRPYKQFYAAMKSWGYYELVSSPADADLIFEISLADRAVLTTATVQASERAVYFIVTLRDPKSQTILWWVAERLQEANRSSTGEKNYNQAMTNLLADLKTMAGQSASK